MNEIVENIQNRFTRSVRGGHTSYEQARQDIADLLIEVYELEQIVLQLDRENYELSEKVNR